MEYFAKVVEYFPEVMGYIPEVGPYCQNVAGERTGQGCFVESGLRKVRKFGSSEVRIFSVIIKKINYLYIYVTEIRNFRISELLNFSFILRLSTTGGLVCGLSSEKKLGLSS